MFEAPCVNKESLSSFSVCSSLTAGGRGALEGAGFFRGYSTAVISVGVQFTFSLWLLQNKILPSSVNVL